MEAVRNLVGVVFRPSKAFESIKEKPSWFLPVILLIVTTVIVTAMAIPITNKLGLQALQENSAKMSPEQLAQAKQTLNSPVIPAIGIISAIVVFIITILIQTSLLHLGASMFGGKASFAVSIATVAYAQVPIAIQQILQSVYTLTSGMIIQPGLSAILPKDQFAGPLGAFLSRIDIFSCIS